MIAFHENYQFTFLSNNGLNEIEYFYHRYGFPIYQWNIRGYFEKKFVDELVKEYQLIYETETPEDSEGDSVYDILFEDAVVPGTKVYISDKTSRLVSVTCKKKNNYRIEIISNSEFDDTKNFIVKNKQCRPSNAIHLLVEDTGYLELNEFELVDFKDFDLSLHYGESFLEMDKVILDRLSDSKSKGIVLLHGPPGTGKTYYLRHLIHNLSHRKIIFIPSYLAKEISSPRFVSFLAEHENSLLIIEDAEDAILRHREGSNNAVANLLNFTDGLLNDCLKINVVCTFNCKEDDVDEALLRKGRLIAECKFDALSPVQSQKLVDFLGYDYKVTEEMTLAEIYNLNEKVIKQNRERKLGF